MRMSTTQRAARTQAKAREGNGDPENVIFKPRDETAVIIKPPRMMTAIIPIVGTAPLVLNAFSQKAIDTIIETQRAGSQSRKGRKREPKDFEAAYQGAMHRSREGWYGIPCSAFRNAAISACRVSGFRMTLAKLSCFILPDGFDAVTGQPLTKITKGEPVRNIMPARPKLGGVDIRARPLWEEGWEMNVHVQWDLDQFSADDVLNLFWRVGMQVGIGEGRHDSRDSAGLGWGTFAIKGGAIHVIKSQ